VHPIKRNGSSRVPIGTNSLDGCLPTKLLLVSDDLSIEHLSGFQSVIHPISTTRVALGYEQCTIIGSIEDQTDHGL
jgi:hypothetical protein